MAKQGVVAATDAVKSMAAAAQKRNSRRRAGERIEQRSASDLGPSLAIERGHVEVERDALVPDDPDDKRSRAVVTARAKRVWPPDRLIGGRNPAIEPHQHDAAVRIFDEYLIGVLGARNHNPTGSYTAPWNRCAFQERRAIARESFLSATKAVGQRFGGILMWCVLMETGSPDRPPTVQAYAKRFSPEWTIDRTVGFLSGALEALAVHYGYSRSNSPSARRAPARSA